MALQLAEINAFVRILLAEPSNTGRWSDSDLATLISAAQRDLALKIDWPVGQYTATSVNNQQEYTLPEIVKIQRVYFAGQPIPHMTIDELQGTGIELYDQTATNYQTQWQSQAAAAYPVASDVGYPVPKVPYFAGQRPIYYQRGANIGFVPKPAGAYTITLDVVDMPATLTNLTDVSPFGLQCKDALAYKTASLCLMADSKDDQANLMTARYLSECAKLESWRNQFNSTAPRNRQMITGRTFFQGGRGRR